LRLLSGRLILCFAASFFGLLCARALPRRIGMIYENIFEARDRRFNPMPGKRFDAGGYKMHIDCTGEGSPTVILDSGLGDTYVSWRKVQPQIAKFARVCSYDRAGLGYSDSSSQPRTSKVIATELHALLQAAGIAPPYVLVGHSMAGFNVRGSTPAFTAVTLPAWCWSMPPIPTRKINFRRNSRTWKEAGCAKPSSLEYTMPFGIPRLLGSMR
jgi:hypothetical protein